MAQRRSEHEASLEKLLEALIIEFMKLIKNPELEDCLNPKRKLSPELEERLNPKGKYWTLLIYRDLAIARFVAVGRRKGEIKVRIGEAAEKFQLSRSQIYRALQRARVFLKERRAYKGGATISQVAKALRPAPFPKN